MAESMLTVEAALERLTAGLRPTEAETVSLADVLDRAPVDRAVTAAHDVPPFANSAMDGFALLAADADDPRLVVGESRAGGPPPPSVGPGTAVRVMTGAPIPPGADAVVPVEEADEQGDRLVVRVAPAPGAHVREAGHDVPMGTQVRLPRRPIGAATVALLAALGEVRVPVHRRPRVAILSTGDELAALGAPLGPGQIHDANGPALAAAVRAAGGEAVLLEPARDDEAQVESRLRDTVGCDLVIASGGVSVGRYDHVRTVLERIGSLDFWRIAVQPGKPLAFGHVDGRPVVGLPGNPVSALVTFELFVRPMLRALLDLPGDGRIHVPARLTARLPKSAPRRAYLRVVVAADPGADGYRAAPAGGQASSQLLPLVAGNALLIVPEGLEAGEAGATYETILLEPVA
jgi:molybdopterin molybdotransferase